MTRRGLMGAITAGTGGLLLAGCGLFGRSTRLHYRITITCDTPAGIKSGMAVQEIRDFDPYGGFRPISMGSHEIVGDAVTFEVDGRNFFFGLTQCSNRVGNALHIGDWQLRSAKVRGSFAEEVRAFKGAGATATLKAPVYEKYRSGGFGLVSFDDLGDFATLRAHRFEELDRTWSILEVVVEPSDEPITRQAQRLLPWLTTVSQRRIKDLATDNPNILRPYRELSDQFGAVK